MTTRTEGLKSTLTVYHHLLADTMKAIDHYERARQPDRVKAELQKADRYSRRIDQIEGELYGY